MKISCMITILFIIVSVFGLKKKTRKVISNLVEKLSKSGENLKEAVETKETTQTRKQRGYWF